MSKPDKTIQQECEELAKELYARMHIPGQNGPYWDRFDDAREVSKIADKIVTIARNAYIKGTNNAHELLKTYNDPK